MSTFDPNAAAAEGSGVFGLPFTEEESALVFVPVPWEATTSYGGGTSEGPAAILEASRQVDLFDLDVERPYAPGLFQAEALPEIAALNVAAKAAAQRIIAVGGDLGDAPELHAALAFVNDAGARLNELVRGETRRLLAAGKLVGVIGGDHSVPFGALQAVAETRGSFGVLHFDAHSDTRDAYEGFAWSHASIMHNVLSRIPEVTRMVQVGIRDVCEQEMDFVAAQGERVRVFYDRDLARRRIEGEPFARVAAEIVAALPEEVWVSFDIDGLDPRFCPHTGTPVPGGMDFHEANYILGLLARSGRRIVGFDLNEVAPGPEGDEWDANVGARLLYKLAAWTLVSHGRARPR